MVRGTVERIGSCVGPRNKPQQVFVASWKTDIHKLVSKDNAADVLFPCTPNISPYAMPIACILVSLNIKCYRLSTQYYIYTLYIYISNIYIYIYISTIVIYIHCSVLYPLFSAQKMIWWSIQVDRSIDKDSHYGQHFSVLNKGCDDWGQ